MSPDEQWVVFGRGSFVRQGLGLRAVPLAGGPTLDLSGPLGPRARILAVEITGDSRFVLYTADPLVDERFELFTVALGSGAPSVPISGTLVAGGRVFDDLALAQDGTRVVYRADASVDDLVELWSAPPDGSAPPVRLSGALPGSADVREFPRLTPDGRVAVYAADATVNERVELFAVPVDGSAPPVRVSGPLQAGGDVQIFFEITADGARVVYRADALADERYELFVAALDGSVPPRRISGPLVAGGDVAVEAQFFGARTFGIAPDGTRVVYRADALVDERFELFGVALDGVGAAIPLSGEVTAAGDVLDAFVITADSRRVLFAADRTGDGVVELFAAPLDRVKEARRVNAPLVDGGDVVAGNAFAASFQVSSDGARVLYLADQVLDGVFELFQSRLNGPPHTGAPRPTSR